MGLLVVLLGLLLLSVGGFVLALPVVCIWLAWDVPVPADSPTPQHPDHANLPALNGWRAAGDPQATPLNPIG